MRDVVMRHQPFGDLIVEDGSDHGRLGDPFRKGRPAGVISRMNRVKAIPLEGFDTRTRPGDKPDCVSRRDRAIQQDRSQGEQLTAHFEKAVENELLLDLAGECLGEAREKGKAGLPSFGRAARNMKIGDVRRHHLNEGFVDDRVHHRVHQGAEPVRAAVLVLHPHDLVPLLVLALEDRFGIEIDGDEITGDVFETVGTLAAFVAPQLP